MLDRELWSRQAKVAADLAVVRDEGLARFTQELERVGDAVELLGQQVDHLAAARLSQSEVKPEPRAGGVPADLDAQLGELKDDVTLLKYTTAGSKTLLDQTQAEAMQAFASETAWLSALATQLERYCQQSLKAQSLLSPIGSTLR